MKTRAKITAIDISSSKNGYAHFKMLVNIPFLYLTLEMPCSWGHIGDEFELELTSVNK